MKGGDAQTVVMVAGRDLTRTLRALTGSTLLREAAGLGDRVMEAQPNAKRHGEQATVPCRQVDGWDIASSAARQGDQTLTRT